MELKLSTIISTLFGVGSFNRTFMELKLVKIKFAVRTFMF